MTTVLYIYLLIGALVASRLAWHVLTTLGQYHWHNRKSDLPAYFLVALLWPILLLNLRFLINPDAYRNEGPWVDINSSVEKRRQELEQLRNNSPPCGPVTRYRSYQQEYEDTHGEFLFQTSLVEKALEERLSVNQHLINDEEGAILNWVHRQDVSIAEPTDTPDQWVRFKYIADNLVRAGQATVYCKKCNSVLDSRQLIENDDHLCPGWNYNRLFCPEGHLLLKVETAHLHMKKHEAPLCSRWG